jgi:hypothetical protein
MFQQFLSGEKLENAVHAIQTLDLEMVKMKISDKEEGKGWTKEQADKTEIAYKQYLTLCLKYPNLSIVPHKDVRDRAFFLLIFRIQSSVF